MKINDILQEKVREENGKWFVYNKTGEKKLSKGYDSKTAANKRLGQIEYFKNESIEEEDDLNEADPDRSHGKEPFKRAEMQRELGHERPHQYAPGKGPEDYKKKHKIGKYADDYVPRTYDNKR